MNYNWQQADWPHFRYNLSEEEDRLYALTEKGGRVKGLFTALPVESQEEVLLDIMVTEAMKTSGIEGEFLSREDVISSIRNNLGIDRLLHPVKDQRAEGVGELMTNIRRTYRDPLTKETLFAWHTMIMRGSRGINAGAWRTHTEPMQVISGALGREKIHFEAPPSDRVPEEMHRFIDWFNDTGPGGSRAITKPVVRSAIAHLYFESIHPFEDGNGRMGRAISEKALAQGLGYPVLLSLSGAIESNKKTYYEALMVAQRSNEITHWIRYFVGTTYDAQKQAELQINFVVQKTRFFDRFKDQLNDRQLRVIQRMLEAGPAGFEGGMNTRKYTAIAKTSKATATRDLQSLVEKNIFLPTGAGRNTKYELLWVSG
ncbi:MAG: Fic family protein [Bacteroidia bacterium]|nr:Fic family protein [Bacteroidia bacterium]